MIRVLVFSTALALRAGLRALLSTDEDIEVLGEASGIEDLGELDGLDVIVVANSTGVLEQLQEQLAEAEPPPAMLLIDDDAEGAELLSELPLRAWGLLPSDCSEEELLAAVHALHEGLIAGTPPLMQPVLGAMPALGLSESDELLDELTPRENEVLQLLAQGLANKQIALQLGISEHTVKFHSSAIYSKLNVTNRTEAVGQGARMGLIVL
jgi:DNA-binding NarL/FixJ family response regulator